MEYRAKSEGRSRKGVDSGMYERKRGCSTGTHRSLHSTQHGARLGDDRTRIAGDVTHDYSSVLGWNFEEKQKDCQA